MEELKETKQNKAKLPNIFISNDIEVTNDLKEAVSDKDILVLAVPSKAIRSVSKSLKILLKIIKLLLMLQKV